MCGFTEIHYINCAHTVTSTAPEHTCLCERARQFHLVQGVHSAPSNCRPVDDADAFILAENIIFDYCDKCRAKAYEGLDSERGEMQDIIQDHAHMQPEELGTYSENEKAKLEELELYVQSKIADSKALCEKLEQFLTANPDTVDFIRDNYFREMMSLRRAKKYDYLYGNALIQCRMMIPVLEEFIAQRFDMDAFLETLKYVRGKVERATKVLGNIEVLLECLPHYDASFPEEGLRGFEAKLELAVNVVHRMVTRAGPDPIPTKLGFYKKDFKEPGEILAQIEADEAAFQAHLVRPMKPSKQTYSQRATGSSDQNALNKNGLKVNAEALGKLLVEEKANEIEYEHITFPEAYATTQLRRMGLKNRMQPGQGVDIKDEYGNRLVWDDQGISRVIFAAPPSQSVDPVAELGLRSDLVAIPQPQPELQTSLKKRPKPIEGYGFGDSSDEDFDNFGDERVSEKKDANSGENELDEVNSPAETGDQITQNGEEKLDDHTPQNGNSQTSQKKEDPPISPLLSIAAGPLEHSAPSPPPSSHPVSPTSSFSSSSSSSRKRRSPNSWKFDSSDRPKRQRKMPCSENTEENLDALYRLFLPL